MIAWLVLLCMVLVALTAPARLFGWICGVLIRELVRDNRPILPPPRALSPEK